MLTVLHLCCYQLLCEVVLFQYRTLHYLSYFKISFMLVGRGRFRINSKIFVSTAKLCV